MYANYNSAKVRFLATEKYKAGELRHLLHKADRFAHLRVVQSIISKDFAGINLAAVGKRVKIHALMARGAQNQGRALKLFRIRAIPATGGR